jgi:hypothetical protein
MTPLSYRATVVLLIGLTSGCASSAQSSQPSLAATVKLSSAPFVHCQGGNSLGNNYLNDVVEPSVAVNRSTIVGAWQQDRWSNGGAHGIVASASKDGGKTWRNSILPFGMCASAGLHYERADDPWVSIGPDGIVYAVAMVFDGAGGGHNSVGAAVSMDRGRTWQHTQIIDTRNQNSQFLDDKDTVTADPSHAGTAYAVWRQERSGNLSPLIFTKTTDGGIHWSKPRVIVPDGGQVLAAIGGQIAVDPKTGTLFNVFLYILKSSSSQHFQAWMAATISHDSGTTWSQPHLMVRTGEIGLQFPVRVGVTPVVAYDSVHRSLDAVWNDPHFNHGRYDGVVFTRSVDGTHWSAPIRVDSTTGKAAFDPMVAVTSDGTVAVTYYQVRHGAVGKNQWLTDYWIRSSTNGGKVFGSPRRVAGPFDITTAPIVEGGYFVGDYEGLAASQKGFALLFVQAHHTGTAAATHVVATEVNR